MAARHAPDAPRLPAATALILVDLQAGAFGGCGIPSTEALVALLRATR